MGVRDFLLFCSNDHLVRKLNVCNIEVDNLTRDS